MPLASCPMTNWSLRLQIRQPTDRLANELIPHFKARQASRSAALTGLLCILSGPDERQRSSDNFLAIGGGQFERVEGGTRARAELPWQGRCGISECGVANRPEADVVASKEHQGVRRNANDFGVTENAIAIHLGCQQGGKGRGVHSPTTSSMTMHRLLPPTMRTDVCGSPRSRANAARRRAGCHRWPPPRWRARSCRYPEQGRRRRRPAPLARCGRITDVRIADRSIGVVHWASQWKQTYGLPGQS